MTTVLKIAGYDFTISRDLPYAEGHVINGPEASTLNQAFVEAIRNNNASKIKALTEPKDGEKRDLTGEEINTLAAEIENYAQTFAFKQRVPGAAKADPVDVEARKQIRAELTVTLKAHGHEAKLKDKDWMAAKIEQLLETKPKYRREAEKRIKALHSAAHDLLSEVDLTDSAPAEAA